jgi:hypothetical protein
VNKFFSSLNKNKQVDQPIIIVSGLPRSGTSLMMKMLAEGGLPIVIDAIRAADDDNPNGYFELEMVKSLPEGNFSWLQEARGKVVKVISSLLEYLPSEYIYKVIFMERDLSEVLASQQKMLTHRNEVSSKSDAQMELQFGNHLAAMKAWLVRQPNIEVLYVNFNALIANPEPICKRISDFIGIPLNINQMMSVPDEQLYRNRAIVERK